MATLRRKRKYETVREGDVAKGNDDAPNDEGHLMVEETQQKAQKQRRKLPDSTSEACVLNDQLQGSLEETGRTSIYIPHEKVGQLLGTKGAIIAQLQNRSGCQILINQDFPPGAPREVTFIGTPTQVHAAQQLVQIVMMNGPLAIQMLDGPILSAEIPCPHKAVGRIIGSQGHTIKDIERRCGVMIKIDENFPEGVDRVISITGNGQAVDRAKDMLEYVMKNGSLGPLNHEDVGPPIPLLTPHHTQLVECPKSSIGRIIGKGGGTINQIQAKSQTKIHIEQNVPVGKPCRIHVTGEISAIQQAIKYLREVAGGPPKPSSRAQSSLPVISLLGDCESSLRPTQSPIKGSSNVPSLPPHWTEHVTDDGHVYWYNSLTSISEWERPQ